MPMNNGAAKEKIRIEKCWPAFLPALLLCLACGRKALPTAPDVYVPPAVKDFNLRQVDHTAVLSWLLSVGEDTVEEKLSGVRVYWARRALTGSGACPDCPPSFSLLTDIPARDWKETSDGRWEGGLRRGLDPGYRYWFYVAVRAENGQTGPPSRQVEVICFKKNSREGD